jgi:hypothetical protein
MPKSASGSTRDVLPVGESLRRAVEWISSRRQDSPELPLYKIVDEASVRFDLSPAEAQFLLANWSRVRDQDAADT